MQDIVDDYIQKHRARAERELAFYTRHENCSDLRTAIKSAILSEKPSGKLNSHQRRLGRKRLTEIEPRIQAAAAAFKRCRSFDELYKLSTRKIGFKDPRALLPYDFAIRLGAYLGLEPERVYLHAGTAEGAKNLDLAHLSETLTISELPAPLRALRPREIEDCLCIYKDAFSTLKQR